ncbi:hypothetical protein [Nocardia sp. NBC_00511]|uniref:hypothetical protein n=1 Tax=Nocardia sp. NBC_00511 TaxID=2903591 RepID=UPI0030E0A40B
MSARGVAIVAACCGLAALSAAPSAHADPDHGVTMLGGCGRGGVLTGTVVPGSGSAGQGVHREADLWDCSSPLLPGIVSGHFTADLPWLGFDPPGRVTIAWSDGSVSTATAYPNALWGITDGPGAGHALRLNLAIEMTGKWYYTGGSMPVSSATFLQ